MMLMEAVIGFLIIGPVLAWLWGMFNPVGYLGVPPWRVPPCTCINPDDLGLRHDKDCPRYPSRAAHRQPD